MGQKESLLSISVGSKASKDNRKDESKEVVQSREAENPINGKKSKSIIKAAIGFAKSLNSASTVFTEKKGSTKNWIRKPSSKSNLTRVRSGSSLVLSTYNNCSRDLFKNNSSDNLLLRRNDTNSAYQTKYVVPLKQQKNSLGANNVMNASLQTQEKIGQATLINVRKSSKINLDYNKFQGASPKIVHQTLDQETDSRKSDSSDTKLIGYKTKKINDADIISIEEIGNDYSSENISNNTKNEKVDFGKSKNSLFNASTTNPSIYMIAFKDSVIFVDNNDLQSSIVNQVKNDIKNTSNHSLSNGYGNKNSDQNAIKNRHSFYVEKTKFSKDKISNDLSGISKKTLRENKKQKQNELIYSNPSLPVYNEYRSDINPTVQNLTSILADSTIMKKPLIDEFSDNSSKYRGSVAFEPSILQIVFSDDKKGHKKITHSRIINLSPSINLDINKLAVLGDSYSIDLGNEKDLKEKFKKSSKQKGKKLKKRVPGNPETPKNFRKTKSLFSSLLMSWTRSSNQPKEKPFNLPLEKMESFLTKTESGIEDSQLFSSNQDHLLYSDGKSNDSFLFNMGTKSNISNKEVSEEQRIKNTHRKARVVERSNSNYIVEKPGFEIISPVLSPLSLYDNSTDEKSTAKVEQTKKKVKDRSIFSVFTSCFC
ncbi:hypothetical protein BB560_002003 [Smittium megazygosporum]|uniref:Uncharacterized protein n=1 Tax=Smittium megazygosporum TaxID=133381 RepID=A0A2T9ZG08_9FUNG|nr:hypothetical protein BB560_002003 [Smittium megazygosporum]